MAKPTIYDLLAKQGIDEITQLQLNTATSNSDVDEASIDFWKGPITLQRVLEMRTYPQGLPIPELSAISAQPVPAEQSVQWQPSGTELWALVGLQIIAGSGTPTCTVELFDGATTCILHSGTTSTTASSFFPWESPLIIDNPVYLQVTNTHASDEVVATIAYHKVGL